MPVLMFSKFDQVPIENKVAMFMTTFAHCKPTGICSVFQRRVTPQ